MTGQSYRVIKYYHAAYADPILVHKGDKVRVTPKSSEWDGWKWCIDFNGRAGWVPEKYLRIDEETAVILRDYSAKELSVISGQILTLMCTESGWGWCGNELGELGWVPLDHIQEIIV